MYISGFFEAVVCCSLSLGVKYVDVGIQGGGHGRYSTKILNFLFPVRINSADADGRC
jgi:hypothetical protein